MRSAVVVALVLAAAAARAHTLAPEELLAALTTPSGRVATGIERASRDHANPRLLLVRVGPRWFALSRETRAAAATDWYAAWRRAVPEGVVAVLDENTDRVVVRFGRGGTVVGLRDAPG
jgi:hypothetical protein